MSTVAERLAAALADRYRIERELGAGGMATVYLAHDLRHDRDVAVKEIRPVVRIGVAPWPMTTKTATVIDGLKFGDDVLTPVNWSPDGRWLAGYVLNPAGIAVGFGLFDVEKKQARRLNDDTHGFDLTWLPDFRHVIYFGPRGTLVMQDIESLERRDITGTLPYPPDVAGSIVAAPGGRTLYYGAKQVEANVWLVKQPVKQ